MASNLCTITPITAFQNTQLSSKINCFQELGARIMRMLGSPMINVEIHPDQLYDAISIACEFFTKYAGYTKEFIIFDSNLYERDKGIRLDHLITVANTGFTLSEKLNDITSPNPDFDVTLKDNLYVSLSDVPKTYFSSSSSLSGSIPDKGIPMLKILDESSYTSIVTEFPELSSVFRLSPKETLKMSCEETNTQTFNNMFDYDIMDYRKVIDVVSFEEGSSSGINSLFSMESMMAQQVFTFAFSNFGFDLLSWQTVKDWIDTREKMLALRRDIHFDSRTQYLRFYPQPKNTHFYGVLECYVERPLRDIIKEKWVLDYSTALCKVMWGRILTKITGVQLPGGGSIDGSSILSEGISEKKELEDLLVSGGYGDFEPIGMFVM